MIKKIISAVVLCLIIVATTMAQSEHVALTSIRKKKWERAHRQLEKIRHRDTLTATGAYVWSVYYSAPQNPDYQLDSALRYSQYATLQYNRLSPREQERIKRFPLDSVLLHRHRARVDSLAFALARSQHTEAAYVHFLTNFSNAAEEAEAIALRDAVAYSAAANENSYQSFQRFIEKYPQARQVSDARRHYERLLYEALTADGRLSSFERFLQQYPQSPYRKNTEEQIFKLSTAAGDESAFVAFIRQHAENACVRQAKNILFYLLMENDPEGIDALLSDDSIRTVQALDQRYLVPFYAAGKYGFMNDTGTQVIRAQYDSIPNDYRCNHVSDDFLVLPDRIVGRNNEIIFSGTVDEVTDLGYGFLEIETQGCHRVVHKTGFIVGDSCVDRARMVAGRFIATQSEAGWSLWTLAGHRIFPDHWDEVSSIQGVIALKKDGRYKLATGQQLATLVCENRNLKTKDTFDDVKPWPNGRIWTRTGEYQGLLDQLLIIDLPFENHSLAPAFFGTIATLAEGKKIYTPKGEVEGVYRNIKVHEPWLALASDDRWRLFDPASGRFLSSSLDSVSFAGPFSIGHTADSLQVYFKPAIQRTFKKCPVAFIPASDSSAFLVVSDGDKKTVYNGNGRKLFTGKYDHVQYAGAGIFIVGKKDKKGLVAHNGKELLPVDFDAIGGVNNNAISLLSKLKFGLYDIVHRRQIKPQYEKNLIHYNEKLLICYKGGQFGFVDWNNKPLGKFDFDEILYWNDTTAFIRKDFQWKLYSIYNEKIVIDHVKKFNEVSDTEEEKIYILNVENDYGIVSNKRGTILPFTFTGIKNIGPKDDPLYLTEKHVEEAAMYIVMYYDKNGTLIRKEIYEDKDYDKIYCLGGS